MDSPYVGEEQEIADCLARAWNLLNRIDQTHPSHLSDFADGIHKCQDVIGHRILQRDYPKVFPKHIKKD